MDRQGSLKKNYCLRMSSWMAVLMLTLVSVSGYSSQEGTKELVKHPNVLFISLDDMNDWVGTLAEHPEADAR